MKSIPIVACVLLVACTRVFAAEPPAAEVSGQTEQKAAITADSANATATQSSTAATATNAQGAQAQLAQATEVSATLTKPVDSGTHKPGDAVTATVTEDVRSNGEVVVPRGSQLVGHVTTARSRGDASAPAASASTSAAADAALGIVFDHAVLKDGRQVPLHATIRAIAVAKSAANARDADTELGAAGSGAGAASTRGGGVLGNTVGSVTGTVSGAASAGVGGSTKLLSRSGGAVGGVNTSGRLTAGSQGVFGLDGYTLTSATTASAEGSVITSAGRNVHLESGTQLILVSGANRSPAP